MSSTKYLQGEQIQVVRYYAAAEMAGGPGTAILAQLELLCDISHEDLIFDLQQYWQTFQECEPDSDSQFGDYIIEASPLQYCACTGPHVLVINSAGKVS